MMRVKKEDTVIVRAGRDRGKTGSVIEIFPDEGKLKVKGVALVTRHTKARKPGEQSGIVKKEGLIDLSNVMPVCPSCKKACRTSVKMLEGDKKARACGRCKEVM